MKNYFEPDLRNAQCASDLIFNLFVCTFSFCLRNWASHSVHLFSPKPFAEAVFRLSEVSCIMHDQVSFTMSPDRHFKSLKHLLSSRETGVIFRRLKSNSHRNPFVGHHICMSFPAALAECVFWCVKTDPSDVTTMAEDLSFFWLV